MELHPPAADVQFKRSVSRPSQTFQPTRSFLASRFPARI
jgi:hypothetical protein